MASTKLKLKLGFPLTVFIFIISYSSSLGSEPLSPTVQAETTPTGFENSTESTSGSTEMTKAPVSAPTSISPTVSTTAVPIIPDSSSQFFCPCDYHLNSCEFNCCCDPNCSDNEKAVFTNCADEASIRKISASRDSRKCYKREFLYRNRTLYRTEISQAGLFCIISENLNKEEEFPIAKVDLNKITEETKSKFYWRPKYVDEKMDLPTNHSYKYGHQILLVKSIGDSSESFQHGMEIPSTAFASECNAKTPVTFLQNMESFCQFQVLNLSLQCETTPILNAETLLQDLLVIGNPSLNPANLINITYLLCPATNTSSPVQNPGCVKTLKLQSPTYNRKTSECINILKELTFVFKHNGVAGIVHVMAHIHYSNHSEASTTKISQKFSTVFEWENPAEDNVHHHPPWFVSGNPGYIIGKPVLIGTSEKLTSKELVTNKTGEEQVTLETLARRKLIINPNFHPLTVLSPDLCNEKDGERRYLLFGYDMSVNCLLDFVNLTSCQTLQMKIGKILVGMHPKNLSRSYVAALGNPDLGLSSHWVPFRTSEDPFKESDSSFKSLDTGCDGILTSMHLHFLYAHVGSIHFPQLKILAALIQFGQSTNIPRKDGNTTQSSILLTTTAKFTDVTPPPVTPLPKWPIISIKLPQDFFYPFSITTSSGSASIPSCGFPFILLCSTTLVILKICA